MNTAGLRKGEMVERGEEAGFVVRSRSVVARQIGGETLIVPVRGKVGDLGSIYSFNQTGSLIWKLLERPQQLPQLVAAVASEYEVSTEQARPDVEQFLQDMLSAGLVEIAAPALVPDLEPAKWAGLEESATT